MAPDLDERPRHLRWTPSTPSTGTTAALFVHGGAYDAAMGRSYRWIIIGTWTHATGTTIDCYVSSIGSEKLRPDEANCSQRCATEDASKEHASTYDVKMKGPELALRFCTKSHYGKGHADINGVKMKGSDPAR